MLNQLTIRPKFTIECLQHSNQQGVGYFEAKYGEKKIDQFKPNFNPIWKRYGVVVHKRNCMDIFRRLSTMHKRDRQTDHGIVTSIATRKIACQRCHLTVK